MKMRGTGRILYLCCLVLCFANVCRCDTCQEVKQHMTYCLSSTQMLLQCPPNYFMKILAATIHKTKAPGCSPPSSDTCLMATVTKDVYKACNARTTCPYIVNEPVTSNCADYSGDSYMDTTYVCQPWMNNKDKPDAMAFSICQSFTWSGVMAYINSYPDAEFETMTYNTNCSCSLTVPAKTRMLVAPALFSKTSSSGDECGQSLDIVDGTEVHKVCKSTTPTIKLGCNTSPKKYLLRYSTNDPSIGVNFMVSFQVHQDEKIVLTCGSEPETTTSVQTTEAPTTAAITTTTPTTTTTTTPTTTPTTTTTTPTTTTTTTTTPTTTTTTTPPTTTTSTTTSTTQPTTTTTTTTSTTTTTTTPNQETEPTTEGTEDTVTPNRSFGRSNKESGTDAIPIIVACVIITILLLLIVSIILILRWRNDKEAAEKKDIMDVEDDTSQFHHISSVYVAGDQRSNLVLHKQPNTMTFG